MASRRIQRLLFGAAASLIVLGGCGGSQRPTHLVLVTVDTLRADHLGSYGSDLGATPNLDALASESLRFETVRAPAPFTLASIAAVMTGRHPLALGVTDNLAALPQGLPTLATRLAAKGWRSGAVVSSLVLEIADPLHAGFDVFDARLPQKEAVRWWVHERDAAATTDAALATLGRLRETGDAPTFLWVHYQDPHGPYTPPPGLRERHLAAAERAPDARRELELTDAAGIGGLPKYQFLAPRRDVAFYRAGYAGEIENADAQIGRLLDGIDALDARTGRGATALVFSADHGEDLGEGDHWFAHGARLGESALRVPLLIRAPGIAPGVRRDPATLLDVLPTIAGLVGLAPSPEWTGRDLLASGPAAAAPFVLVTGASDGLPARRGVVEGGYKLVEGGDSGEVLRLYRLPDESADLSAEEPETLRALRRVLDRDLEARAPATLAPQADLLPEEREGLRAMGYLDDEPARASP